MNRNLRLIAVKAFSTICALTAVAGMAQTQEMPDHDILMLDLQINKTQVSVSNPRVIADEPGYDNQPYFLDSHSLYYTRIEDANADIWYWNNDKKKRLTKTLESEYSPTPIPFRTGSFSTVRVEHDGTQRLWQVNNDNSFELLFPEIKPVGYHVWQKKNIAMFILGEPHRLAVTAMGKDKLVFVDNNIGRCLALVPGSQRVSYTTINKESHLLKTYDFSSGEIASLLSLPNKTQDYAWLNKDMLLSSDGEQLMWRHLNTNDWQPVQTPSDFKLKSISRLAISPDKTKLAVVYIK